MIQPMMGLSRMPVRMMAVLAGLLGAASSRGMSNAAQMRPAMMRMFSGFMVGLWRVESGEWEVGSEQWARRTVPILGCWRQARGFVVFIDGVDVVDGGRGGR